MNAPVVGFTVRREAFEPAPPSNAVMSVIGLIGPAVPGVGTGASEFNDAFPVDEPVAFGSTSPMARMIDPNSYVGDAIAAINAQMARLNSSARIVFVRTDEGATVEDTITNIVGNAASRTGLHAFTHAGSHVGHYARLIAAPGYTSWQADPMSANPIAAELPGVLNGFLGIGVVDAPGTNRDDAIAYRETLQSERLVVVDPAVKVRDSFGNPVIRPYSPRVLGLMARRDFEFGGRPFRSILNQPVYGIEGPSRPIEFSLTDGASEGQDLLSHQIGALVRGESGDDFSIADGGFINLAFENTTSDEIWRHVHKVRGRDFIELTTIRTLRNYLGRFNLTTQTIQAIVNTVGNILSQAQARGEILGYTARFDPNENNPDDLRTGKIFIDARFEEDLRSSAPLK